MVFNLESVFGFQEVLQTRYGSPTRLISDPPEKIPDFFKDMEQSNVNQELCVDIGNLNDVSASCVDNMEYDGNRLIIYGGNNGEVDGVARFEMFPIELQVNVDPDPRKSYAAILTRDTDLPDIVENNLIFKLTGKHCVLLYPHGSLLRTTAYKAAVLTDHGMPMYNENCGEETFRVSPRANKEWLDTILQRMKKKFSYELRKNHNSARGYDFHIHTLPKEGASKRGNDENSNCANITFSVEHPTDFNSGSLEDHTKELLKRIFPSNFTFDTFVVPKDDKNLEFSIMLELPE